MALLDAVTNSMSYIFRWIRTLLNVLLADTGYLHQLLPLFAIGIAISAILLGIKIVRSLIWGA